MYLNIWFIFCKVKFQYDKCYITFTGNLQVENTESLAKYQIKTLAKYSR